MDEDEGRPEDEEQPPAVERTEPPAVVQVMPMPERDEAEEPQAYEPQPISPGVADHLVQTMEWREGDPLPSDDDLIKAIGQVEMDKIYGHEPYKSDFLDIRPGGVPIDDGRLGGLLAGSVPPPEADDGEPADGGEEPSGSNSPPGLIQLAAKVAGPKGKDGADGDRDSLGFPTKWDAKVDQEVAAYNQSHGFKPGDEEYLDPQLIKAQIRVESGGSPKAYANDPMQVNNPGDWGKGEKKEFGLQKGVSPGPDLSIRAGIGWLAKKAYVRDDEGNVTFKSWDRALERYGPPDTEGLAPYRKRVRAIQQQITPATPAPATPGADDDD